MPGRGRRRRFGRPIKNRVLAAEPVPRGFIPTIPPTVPMPIPPGAGPDHITMTADEYEAYRLTEYDGLGQEEAAEKMGISRGTLWRILQSAKKKLARMMVEGQRLQISGGNYVVGSVADAIMTCPNCGHRWTARAGADTCPKCGLSTSKG